MDRLYTSVILDRVHWYMDCAAVHDSSIYFSEFGLLTEYVSLSTCISSLRLWHARCFPGFCLFTDLLNLPRWPALANLHLVVRSFEISKNNECHKINLYFILQAIVSNICLLSKNVSEIHWTKRTMSLF